MKVKDSKKELLVKLEKTLGELMIELDKVYGKVIQMEVKKYRKKSIIVEAVQYTGTIESFNDVRKLVGDSIDHHGFGELFISTPEGLMRIRMGDWVIRGVKGEFYPCKPDIFKLTYDVV